MAAFPDFPQAARRSVARQVRQRAGFGSGLLSFGPDTVIGESVPLLRLTLTDAQEPAVRATGAWHHQIITDGKPAYYATTIGQRDGIRRPRVVEIAESNLPAALDQMIGVADAAGFPGAIGGLLVVSSLGLAALWLDDGESAWALVCVAPLSLAEAGSVHPGHQLLGNAIAGMARSRPPVEPPD